MPADESEEHGTDLIETFRGILFSDDVVEIRDSVYKIVRKGRDEAFSLFTGEDEIQYNWDYLKKEDVEIRLVENGPNEPPFRPIRAEDREIIELNYTVLDDDKISKFTSQFEPTFDSQGRLLTHEQEVEFNVADGARGDPQIEEILEFFSFLPMGDLRLLRRSLSIRKAWEDEDFYVEREQMDGWKQALDRKFGSHGSTVANYCSSGYYELDGVIPEMMREIQERYDDLGKIQSLYDNIIENQPFVVYVGKNEDPERISRRLRRKLKQHDSYDYKVPYVELRAQGWSNRSVAEKAIQKLDDEIPDTAIESYHSDIEFVFRIDPNEIGDLEGI